MKFGELSIVGLDKNRQNLNIFIWCPIIYLVCCAGADRQWLCPCVGAVRERNKRREELDKRENEGGESFSGSPAIVPPRNG